MTLRSLVRPANNNATALTGPQRLLQERDCGDVSSLTYLDRASYPVGCNLDQTVATPSGGMADLTALFHWSADESASRYHLPVAPRQPHFTDSGTDFSLCDFRPEVCEVEHLYVAYNFSLFALHLPKLLKFVEICLSYGVNNLVPFFRHGIYR